jgi:hypothetical protein
LPPSVPNCSAAHHVHLYFDYGWSLRTFCVGQC